jgi:hypothetical protein
MSTETTSTPVASAKTEALKLTLAKWSAGGASALLVWEIFRLLERSDMAVSQVLQWGPMFVVSLALMMLADRRAGQFIDLQAQQTAAMLGIQTSFQQMAARDDQRAREQEIVLDHLAQNSEKLLRKMEAIEERLKT